ncbi:MAG TPA: substrate-binding domain-containing protein [Aliidongia sp.]|nr:substrate-binding domain-containing protein [Aliidongia sp.]
MLFKSQSRLLGMASTVALSTATFAALAAFQPAAAQSVGLYGGGSSLSSLTMRQIFDCFGHHPAADGYATTTVSPLTPGQLPSTCAAPFSSADEGLFASVGSGRGLQAFVANDAKQLVNGGPNGASSTVSLPAVPPVFIDTGSSSSAFNTYPYPSLVFGASDAPLPISTGNTTITTSAFTFNTSTNWDVDGTTTPTTIAVTATATVTYDAANRGAAVQLPLFEAPVAIAINTNNASKFQIQSALTAGTAGSAIQLSTAQVCAIFSGTVTDWDSTANITALNAAGSQITEPFDTDNVGLSAPTPQPYASSTLPIQIVYRGDGSGTSFIFANYLHNSCAPLANATNSYSTIFPNPLSSTGVPNTSFLTAVVNNALAVHSGAHFTPETGSIGVATQIGTARAAAGSIGYLSADFTQPYANATILGTAAPLSASIQDQSQQSVGILHPSQANFIAPTPAGADGAFQTLEAFAPVNSTFSNVAWNLYAAVYPTSAGTTLAGKSILGIPNQANAYPITGTTFMFLSSCYSNASAATDLTNFIDWYYGGTTGAANGTVSAVLANNGFSPLIPAIAGAIVQEYANGGSASITAASTGGNGCPSGAHGA